VAVPSKVSVQIIVRPGWYTQQIQCNTPTKLCMPRICKAIVAEVSVVPPGQQRMVKLLKLNPPK
jgi:hypothetical protein